VSAIDRFLPDLLENAALLSADHSQVESIVSSHLSLRDTPAGDATASLLVPASLVTRFREVVDPDHDLRISLYGDTGLDGVNVAREAVQDDAWITIDHVVLPVLGAGRTADDVATLLDHLPFTVPTYIELPIDEALDASLEVLAQDGAERAAFGPTTPDRLAAAIVAAVRRAVPFTIDATNGPSVTTLLAATSLALDTSEESAVALVLRANDPAQLARLLDGDRASDVRGNLRSVICRSVADSMAEQGNKER
jgi:hypothetical protein